METRYSQTAFKSTLPKNCHIIFLACMPNYHLRVPLHLIEIFYTIQKFGNEVKISSVMSPYNNAFSHILSWSENDIVKIVNFWCDNKTVVQKSVNFWSKLLHPAWEDILPTFPCSKNHKFVKILTFISWPNLFNWRITLSNSTSSSG